MAVIEVAPDEGLTALLERLDAIGGVLDYVALRASAEVASPASHRAAALAGIAEIGRRLGWARLQWDESKLSGEPVSFTTFWGTDDVRPKPLGQNGWSIPNVDGYKTAFFHPPYRLLCSDGESEQLFDKINAFVLGSAPAGCEIFSWSTAWSNYFDAGKEWWGAFYWTVRPAKSDRLYVIGASSTD
jgi:hypothetical protein